MNYLGGILAVGGFTLSVTTPHPLPYVIGLALLVAGFALGVASEEERRTTRRRP